ncbi:Osmotically-inducible protein OsmY, contains BON domain [Granulicella rosea]|uniref:Osmotically-inducible protein OsmY, contains BON domain n=1 Tax=Granulicella rosea TaxID=474952 RepID=A0A239E3D5_9BACT|nr:BON domain-containing protein [Granulicella rosea]SNS38482.1 Osmotically-inducible protein OsmY, contains BON domain [Granulicella rosea]
MSTTKTISRLAFAAVMAAGLMAARPSLAQVNADPVVQADVNKALDKKQFANVKGVAHNGIVTLTGTVDVYAQKEDADKRIHHLKTVASVQNMIQVGGPQVEDATLRNKLAEKISYDRVGYGTTAFNSFTIGVQDGVVTLGGTAYGPVDKDSAISLVANYPGVKDVVDNIEVAPLSPNDDRIRIAEARSIYGFPTLNRYAIDPAKPIRITVVNGNVTLNGVVDSKMDRDTANIRANAVPGVFKVTNNLQVASAAGGN